MRTLADLARGAADTRHHARQRVTHAVEAVRQLADLVAAAHVQADAEIARTQCLRLLHHGSQRLELVPQQPDGRGNREDHRQQVANGQPGADAPGHVLYLGRRHARQHGPGAAFEEGRDAVDFLVGIAPVAARAVLADQLGYRCSGLVGLPQIGRRDQPLAFFVEQRERAGFADAKARQVVELDPLCVGVVEADEQHGDHLAGKVLHRRVLSHVVPVEEERAADVLLSTE